MPPDAAASPLSAVADFLAWTDCLLNPAATPGEQREAGQAWCRWGLGLLGIDSQAGVASGESFGEDRYLVSGKAISPLGAARCVWEYRRTAVFLQAMDAALREMFVRFPGETIHVLEAGCGPLAPLALAFAVRYPPERVQFSLLDLHPIALAGAKKIAAELGVSRSIRAYLLADATEVRFAETERPHLIACEVMLRALTREPQVAVTRHLAPQLRPGGAFLPECVAVDACLFDAAKYHRPWDRPGPFDRAAVRAASIVELGPVFRLEAAQAHALPALRENRLAAQAVRIPPHDRHRQPLQLFTRIQVWRDHWLHDFDSSLNLPEEVKYPERLAREGGELHFEYEIATDPGLRVCE